MLLDSLICVFVAVSLCLLCFSIYKAILNYWKGYLSYQEDSNERYVSIFNGLYECEACVIDESD